MHTETRTCSHAGTEARNHIEMRVYTDAHRCAYAHTFMHLHACLHTGVRHACTYSLRWHANACVCTQMHTHARAHKRTHTCFLAHTYLPKVAGVALNRESGRATSTPHVTRLCGVWGLSHSRLPSARWRNRATLLGSSGSPLWAASASQRPGAQLKGKLALGPFQAQGPGRGTGASPGSGHLPP